MKLIKFWQQQWNEILFTIDSLRRWWQHRDMSSSPQAKKCTSWSARHCSLIERTHWWMIWGSDTHEPFTNMRLQSMTFTLAGAVTVNQIIQCIKIHSTAPICLFIFEWMESSTSSGCRLFCLIYDLDMISSAAKLCDVAKSCGWLFMVFGTELSHSAADMILFGRSRSSFFSIAVKQVQRCRLLCLIQFSLTFYNFTCVVTFTVVRVRQSLIHQGYGGNDGLIGIELFSNCSLRCIVICLHTDLIYG